MKSIKEIIMAVFLFFVVFSFGRMTVTHNNSKVVLEKKEHIRQCERNIGIGNFICDTDISLEETKEDWCK